MISNRALNFIKGSTIGVAIFGLLATMLIGFVYFNGVMEIRKKEQDFQNRIAGFVNPFFLTDSKIVGRAALVVDAESNIVLYAKKENNQLPIASLTKIMSTLVAGQYLEENKIETVKIGNVNILAQADANFISGKEWRAEDLLTAMLVSSSNVAAESIFGQINKSQINPEIKRGPITLVAMMNETARNLKLTNTKFLNSTGLDIKDESADGGYSFGGVSNTREVLYMARVLETVFPDLASKTSLKEISLNSLDGFSYVFQNTDPLIQNLPIYFSKTGYTDKAGGSLVVRTKIGDKFVYIVVLGSTKDGRFSDIEKLYDRSVVLLEDLANRGVELEELKEHDLIGYGY